MVAVTPAGASLRGYQHGALLYSGVAGFVGGTTPFIRHAIDAGDPVLVMVGQDKVNLLRRELGIAADRVRFADMARVGANPGRIIAAWEGFVRENAAAEQLWGIGEPVYPARGSAELAECHLHEALLNVAFDTSRPFFLMCPYDVAALAADVICQARRTHPFVVEGSDWSESSDYHPVKPAEVFDRRLDAPPFGAEVHCFDADGLGEVRTLVAAYGARAGLSGEALEAFVLAVNEATSNSIRYGGGAGEVAMWVDSGSVVCEVRDRGHVTEAMAGRLLSPPDVEGGRGLWIANYLCDLVQISSSRTDGTTVRLHIRL